MILLLAACQWNTPEAPPPEPPPAVEAPPPEPLRGVAEVVTPASILRASDVQEKVGTVSYDVWFDADHTTFEALGKKLEDWGFVLLDGDGESWRVTSPPGRDWGLRLEPLPDVLRVREALDREPNETGSYREGSERYGDAVHTWAHLEGGPTESLTGATPPPPIVLPHALPPGIVRCLAPARSEMVTGVATGPGWERALQTAPPAWVIVLEDHGFCRAGGHLVLRPDAPIDTLSVGGRSVAQADAAWLQSLAVELLRGPRATEDTAAMAALDTLSGAGDEVLAAAIAEVSPGYFQEQLYRKWEARSPAAASEAAMLSGSPALRANVVDDDIEMRRAALLDPRTPVAVQLAALATWRQVPSDPPSILDRLRESPDPRVRERAWERTLDARAEACAAGFGVASELDVGTASQMWKDCPEPAVRRALLERVRGLDPEAATGLLTSVLVAPETVRAGIAAVREAVTAGRHDLLVALVSRRTVSRDVRLVALTALVEAHAPGSAELVDVHGRYLGYRPAHPKTSTADQVPPP